MNPSSARPQSPTAPTGFLTLKRRERIEYTLFGLAAVPMFSTKRTGALLQSTLRYLRLVFPAFAAAAHYLRRRWVLYLLLGLSLLANVGLAYFYMVGRAAARPT